MREFIAVREAFGRKLGRASVLDMAVRQAKVRDICETLGTTLTDGVAAGLTPIEIALGLVVALDAMDRSFELPFEAIEGREDLVSAVQQVPDMVGQLFRAINAAGPDHRRVQ